MAVFDNMIKTNASALAPSIVDQYYERQLLDVAMPSFVHLDQCAKKTMPQGQSRVIQFRRYAKLAARMTPLKEGVTPAGQSLSVNEIFFAVNQYGGHIEYSEELNLFVLDNAHRQIAKALADQAALTLDSLLRDAMNAGLNVQYVGGKASRNLLAATNKLTYDELRKAVRFLEGKDCPRFPDGFYHAIVHPYVVYDLMDDTMFKDIAKYQDKSKAERYEIGTMAGVKFFESTNAKVFEGDSYVYGSTATIDANADWDSTNKCMTVASMTDDIARDIVGRMFNMSVTVSGTETLTPMYVEKVDVAAKKIYFRWQPATTTAWTEANALKLKPMGAGASSAKVYSTPVFGPGAFARIQLEGAGKSVRFIHNPPGSSGALDPLNQRGTSAWKIPHFACGILDDDRVIRIEGGASA